MKTLSEMKTLVENGKTHLLTIEKAKELKGKTISTIYFGYSGQDGVDNFIVGEVMSELEYYRNLKEDCFPDKYGFKNRAEYWESYMNKEKLEEKKNTNLLLTADGRNTYIRETGEGVFWCSDEDRWVRYVED